ncbi:antitoxin [Raoultibacter phocaeensis]|uniref:antitoxin n=1 Tax=Raoultibacter phocaeensis TaxID=2479841 RepID=UPI00111A1A8B|nr:antitoxin [Raoultibacter phocaeensis]
MAQISLYLEDETMAALRKKATLANASLSKYVADLIRNDVASGWPTGYWDLFGSIEDETFCEPEELSFSVDGVRGAW